VEAELLVESLLLRSLVLVKIEYIPLLVLSSVVTPDAYCLSFNILSSLNIENFAALPVNELVVLILENLEPA
jgi:hypothetical protein